MKLTLAVLLATSLLIQADPPMPPTNRVVNLRVEPVVVPNATRVFLLHVPEGLQVPCVLQRSSDLLNWRSVHRFTNEVTRTIYYFAAPGENAAFFRMSIPATNSLP